MGKDSVASLLRGAPRAQGKNHRKEKRFWQIFVGKIFLFSKFGRSKVFSISNFSKIWDFSFVAPPISAIPGLSKICFSPILPNLETVGHPWVLIWQKLANLNFDQPSLSQNWEKSNLALRLFSLFGQVKSLLVSTNPNICRMGPCPTSLGLHLGKIGKPKLWPAFTFPKLGKIQLDLWLVFLFSTNHVPSGFYKSKFWQDLTWPSSSNLHLGNLASQKTWSGNDFWENIGDEP